jgi:hypothetical protein
MSELLNGLQYTEHYSYLRGMASRVSPTNRRDKERLRQLQLRREEEQDRIIRIIKGKKK